MFHVKQSTKTVSNENSYTRYKEPYNNLLYGILLQAVKDRAQYYLKHGDGALIWEYLRTQRKRGE